jgi:PadR family transcriptional regulator, regulatory protein PadR
LGRREPDKGNPVRTDVFTQGWVARFANFVLSGAGRYGRGAAVRPHHVFPSESECDFRGPETRVHAISFDALTKQCYSTGVSNKDASKADVLQGTLDLMVLQTLGSLGPLHGYAIAARLEQVSGGAIQLNMGTLYPALMRLEQRGLLRGTWGTSETNRKARFYALTPAGRRQLSKEKQAWDRMAAIMHSVLRGDA